MNILRTIVGSMLLLWLSLPAAAEERNLTMERAIQLAVSRNERSGIADAGVEAARARVRRARAFFFPELTLSTTYTRRAYETSRIINDERVVLQSFNANSSLAQVNATLFDARAFPLYRQAKLERESAELLAADEKRVLEFEAADAFITTLSLEQLLDAARRRRDLANANLSDANARFEAGLVSSNDVTKARLELATAEREVTSAAGDVAIAYLELGNLLNTDVTGPLQPPAEFLAEASHPVDLPETIIRMAKETRPDLEASRRHLLALEEFADEPMRRFIPSLNLAAQFRNTSEAGLSGRNNDGSAAVTLSWPVFDGGERYAERAERLALARSARLGVEASVRQIELGVRTSIVDITSDQASIEQAVSAVRAATQNLQETQELYRQGLATALEVTDAGVRLFEAEVAAARARYQLALAYLNLRAARGLTPLGQEIHS